MYSTSKGSSILEKWLEDMPNSNKSSVKRERRDFDDLLARHPNSSTNLFSKSSSSSLLPSSFSSLLPNSNSFNRTLNELSGAAKPKPASPVVQDSSNCIDEKSIKGIFGWSTVNDIPLPVILRGEQKLIPVRVVESKIIGKYSECLPWTVFSCINIRSYYVTENEAKLLNEINAFHCDYHYGYESFTGKDVVVSLSDVSTLSKFLETSKDIFAYGLSKLKLDWLGFINISRSLVVPYIAKKQSSSSSILNSPNNLSSSNENGIINTSTIASNDNSNHRILQRYVPESMISNHVFLVKVEKTNINEWDASYLRMLCIYAGMDHYQIPSNEKLCLLCDLKWDATLNPLLIEEYDPPVKLAVSSSNYCVPSRNSPASPNVNNIQSATSDIHPYSPSSKSTNSDSLDHQSWTQTANGGLNSSKNLNSLYHVTKLDINGISLSAINLKPYSTQQAVLWRDVITKMFPEISQYAALYFFEKVLHIELHECNSYHEEAFLRVNKHITGSDKLVAVDILKKYLPQLRELILMSINSHPFIN